MMIQKWACGHCKTIWDIEEEANQCCEATEVWECDKCGDWTDDKQDYCNACEEK